jgi:hypothetical protein
MQGDFSERSYRAQENGRVCEALIKDILPGLEPAEGSDFSFMGAPLEIKSCQVKIDRSDEKNPRSGRFYLRDYQHSELLEKNGRYVLAVMDGAEIVHSKIILASKFLPEFTGNKTVSWSSVFKVKVEK